MCDWELRRYLCVSMAVCDPMHGVPCSKSNGRPGLSGRWYVKSVQEEALLKRERSGGSYS